MINLKTILAATDLSDHAEIAIKRAALLARQNGAKLELLHVLDDWTRREQAMLPPFLPAEPLMRQAAEEARETLGLQAKHLLGDDLQPELRVDIGKDFVAIIQRARQIKADLIVVGVHGNNLARNLFLGTTAEKVVRKGDRPVLVVKKPAETPYQRVLVPTDFSDASRQAFLTALALAPKASFDLLHAYRLWGAGRLNPVVIGDEDMQRYQNQLLDSAGAQMKEYFKTLNLGNLKCTRHLLQGNPAMLITAQAVELRSDLIAVGTEGLSNLPYLLLGSVTEHVMRHAECDVLAVRPSNFCFRLP